MESLRNFPLCLLKFPSSSTGSVLSESRIALNSPLPLGVEPAAHRARLARNILESVGLPQVCVLPSSGDLEVRERKGLLQRMKTDTALLGKGNPDFTDFVPSSPTITPPRASVNAMTMLLRAFHEAEDGSLTLCASHRKPPTTHHQHSLHTPHYTSHTTHHTPKTTHRTPNTTTLHHHTTSIRSSRNRYKTTSPTTFTITRQPHFPKHPAPQVPLITTTITRAIPSAQGGTSQARCHIGGIPETQNKLW